MSDLDMYNTYVSRDVIEPLYKNSYRGYIPAFNQFVNNIDNLTMADIEQGNALRIHARHISVLYSNIATLRAEKSDEIATLRTEKNDEIATLRTEKDAEIATLRTEKYAEIATLRTEKDAEIATLRAEKDAEIATLHVKITDLSTALVYIRADIAELQKAK
ncbi:hypothetical protein EXVG_00135 [Emiliania huxleyi virus 202]|nr:hypothetical protein EXVG_00135 [Emiliania huxleyi virus 202]AHA55109.1 hypothetical protein EhV156_00008 [Emiliania huxleyi virus 156]